MDSVAQEVDRSSQFVVLNWPLNRYLELGSLGLDKFRVCERADSVKIFNRLRLRLCTVHAARLITP